MRRKSLTIFRKNVESYRRLGASTDGKRAFRELFWTVDEFDEETWRSSETILGRIDTSLTLA